MRNLYVNGEVERYNSSRRLKISVEGVVIDKACIFIACVNKSSFVYSFEFVIIEFNGFLKL